MTGSWESNHRLWFQMEFQNIPWMAPPILAPAARMDRSSKSWPATIWNLHPTSFDQWRETDKLILRVQEIYKAKKNRKFKCLLCQKALWNQNMSRLKSNSQNHRQIDMNAMDCLVEKENKGGWSCSRSPDSWLRVPRSVGWNISWL